MNHCDVNSPKFVRHIILMGFVPNISAGEVKENPGNKKIKTS